LSQGHRAQDSCWARGDRRYHCLTGDSLGDGCHASRLSELNDDDLDVVDIGDLISSSFAAFAISFAAISTIVAGYRRGWRGVGGDLDISELAHLNWEGIKVLKASNVSTLARH
jgi:hypothetical protein